MYLVDFGGVVGVAAAAAAQESFMSTVVGTYGAVGMVVTVGPVRGCDGLGAREQALRRADRVGWNPHRVVGWLRQTCRSVTARCCARARVGAGYMAPEQFRGAAQPASDAYALGATLLFLLSGAWQEWRRRAGAASRSGRGSASSSSSKRQEGRAFVCHEGWTQSASCARAVRTCFNARKEEPCVKWRPPLCRPAPLLLPPGAHAHQLEGRGRLVCWRRRLFGLPGTLAHVSHAAVGGRFGCSRGTRPDTRDHTCWGHLGTC